MNRKALILILILLALAGGAVYWVKTHRSNGLILTGIVTTDEVNVSAQISGQLEKLLVREGDGVTRGQLLALIQPQELRADQQYYAHSAEGFSAQVTESEAALRYQEAQTRDQISQAEADLAAAQAQQTEAAAALERAKFDYDRAQDLAKQGIVSQQQADQARTTLAAAHAHVDALRKQVDAQRAAVALAKSNAEQTAVRRSQLAANQHQVAAAQAQTQKAAVRLGYTEIRSPIDGLVAVRTALQGEVVNPGQPIVTLIDPDNLWVRTDVEETYIDRIRLGDQFQIRLPSGATLAGTVFYRGVDAGFATQRDVSRTKRDIKTFEIRLRVDNRDRRLYPGLTAYVDVPFK
jgi:multidrug resistance efflux pump